MSEPSELSQSPDDFDERWSQAESKFRQACRSSAANQAQLARVRLEDFLPDVNDSHRRTALYRLIPADLQRRWTLGQHDLLEQYMEEYPEIGGPGDLPPRLIYEEFLVRQRFDRQVAMEEYESRFPEQFAEFRQLVEKQGTLLPPCGTTRSPGNATTPFDGGGSPVRDLLADGAHENEGTVGQGRYTLEGFLGEGAYGSVWRARAPGGVHVAAKFMKTTVEQLTARELRSLDVIKDLNHPFLLPVHAYWMEGQQLIVITDLADMTLQDRLEECQADGLPGIRAEELANYIHDAAAAIDFLHQQRVIHQDIKPANILLVNQRARVGDFGLVEVLEQHGDVRQEQGTPPYMSPEAFARRPCEQSDQYSLAVTYVELRAGKLPFDLAGKTLQGIREHISQAEPDLEGLGKREQRVLRRALAKDPSKRFPNCRAFCAQLEKAIHPPPPYFRMAIAAILLLSLMAFGNDWFQNRGYKLTAAAHEFVPAGGEQKIVVNVTRERYAARQWELELEKPESSNHIQFSDWTYKPDGIVESIVRVESPNAASDEPYTVVVNLVDSHGKRQSYKEMQITVTPPTTRLPSGFQGNADLGFPEEGPILYKEIYKEVEGCKNRVEFRLICHQGLPPFYIMKDKVWNELFQRFVEHQELGDGLQVGSDELGKLVDVHPCWPVFRVSVEEAHSFAEWLAGDWEGRLPSTAEWDAAAGCSTGGGSPIHEHQTDGDDKGVAIGLTMPLDVGEARFDENTLGIRDLLGNGFEWTRNVVFNSKELEIPLDAETLKQIRFTPFLKAKVRLRGMTFTGDEPFKCEKVEHLIRNDTYGKKDELTSFRTVIKIVD